MPYINVKVAGKLKKKQKEDIAKGICELLEVVADKPKNSTYVVFDEVDRENWAVGESLLA
ncbi:MAG: 4-oxalocrotonate tautomerase family protein [Candidatus Margulisbacteria bacterium]|nr:4-oxalocrotonate tautomerase family protein [Candidatus Margulisiibacteriota bacterium]